MSHPQPPSPATSLIAIVNARVWTNDPARPWADALLVRAERIVAVGSSAELRKRAGAGATIIDARSWLLLPTNPEESLRAGAPAALVIVERTSSGDPPAVVDRNAVVFELAQGRIVLDRHGLAR
jgi:predicted amidohydrolase YtcJ